MSELRFDGRVAIVTGAGRGVGRSCPLNGEVLQAGMGGVAEIGAPKQ